LIEIEGTFTELLAGNLSAYQIVLGIESPKRAFEYIDVTSSTTIASNIEIELPDLR
jgi:hypothetical protein